MENKKNKLLILMIVLCIMVPIGGAIAYFRADTSSSNKLSSGNIGIELRDATTNEDGQITDEGINFNFGYPGAILVDIIELMLFKIKSYCTIVPLPILYYNNRCLSTKF